MRVPRGAKGRTYSTFADEPSAYTVFATAQMLPGFAQEKLNRAERQASVDVNGKSW
jgi:hypothetical protein